ncbi:hypothetical protein [Paenisporosarcina sp. TG-14]|uniref:hypothetical protein n=1 Tax=Paenisporosarcina sp. TG-14 TaxID=1231057 RepID=UPI00178C5CF8|nr:hypothetical protein [Paenisporosarcina sp. TG-14]
MNLKVYCEPVERSVLPFLPIACPYEIDCPELTLTEVTDAGFLTHARILSKSCLYA